MTSSSAHTTTHPMQLDLLLPKIIHECSCNLPIHHSATYPLLHLIYIIDHLYNLYILVQLKSYVRKLLTQFARDQRETRDYYRVPHGDGYMGVDGT